jgi:molybdopterin molybdotransferase
MISLEAALQRLQRGVGEAVSPGETVELALAVDRAAAETVRAHVALPAFDQSAMDGYALAPEDCETVPTEARWLEIVGEQAAGAPSSGSVTSGHAVRIFTGAPVPPGTGGILMQEDATRSADGRCIRATERVVAGEFIRRRGLDVCEGLALVQPGQALTPARLALLATQGRTEVCVGRQPRVAVISTGDELTPPGQPLPHAAAIYNSNQTLLQALLPRAGAQGAAVLHAVDTLVATLSALEQALAVADVVLVSGGVSVGEYDYVKPALSAIGCELEFWRVAVKPGKPFLVARRGAQWVFGLPGNPVSAAVTFHLFVQPLLWWWQGGRGSPPSVRSGRVTLAEPLRNPDARPHYLRGFADETGAFSLTGLQESHALAALSRANALVCVPPQTTLAAGETALARWL